MATTSFASRLYSLHEILTRLYFSSVSMFVCAKWPIYAVFRKGFPGFVSRSYFSRPTATQNQTEPSTTDLDRSDIVLYLLFIQDWVLPLLVRGRFVHLIHFLFAIICTNYTRDLMQRRGIGQNGSVGIRNPVLVVDILVNNSPKSGCTKNCVLRITYCIKHLPTKYVHLKQVYYMLQYTHRYFFLI